MELDLTGLAINTVLQSHHVNDFEGADAASVTFDAMPQSSVQEMVTSGQGKRCAMDALRETFLTTITAFSTQSAN